MSDFFVNNGFLIVSMVLAAILALSLYIPLMAGQLSLASPGFYALGGYIAAFMSTKVFPSATGSYPISLLLLEMLIAGAVSGVLAVLVGVPALRLRGIYLALATIAFVEIVRVLSLAESLESITGGAVGIFNIPQPFSSKIGYLLVAGPLLLVSGAFVYRLEHIRVGRAFIAIREDELAADAMGISPTRYKVLAFTLGAILAGVVGAVSAHVLNTWNARQGTFDASINYLAFVLIGGSRTFVGPIVGGLALTALPELLRALADLSGLPPWFSQFLRDGRLIIYGVLLAIGTVFFPQGIITPELLRRPRRSAIAQVDVASASETIPQKEVK
jgi:branched-chain amino acid transport system permease protein